MTQSKLKTYRERNSEKTRKLLEDNFRGSSGEPMFDERFESALPGLAESDRKEDAGP